MVTWLEMVGPFKKMYRKDMDNFIVGVNKVNGNFMIHKKYNLRIEWKLVEWKYIDFTITINKMPCMQS